MFSVSVKPRPFGQPRLLARWVVQNILRLQGRSAFSPQQIKDGLSLTSAFNLSADATAPLDEYLKTIKRLVHAGYRHAGFPDVEVLVSTDTATHTVAVNVKEGFRYWAGDVQVNGSRTVSVQTLDRLTKPYPPRNALPRSWSEYKGESTVTWVDRDGGDVELCAPVWCSGKPACFPTMSESDSDLHKDVTDALADLGYFFARFSVKVVADMATRKAHLLIDISDEGVQSKIGTVDIAGNKANSREDVLKYITFRHGTAATRVEQVRLQKQLWQSGRFIKSEVTLLRPATPGNQAKLQINVV